MHLRFSLLGLLMLGACATMPVSVEKSVDDATTWMTASELAAGIREGRVTSEMAVAQALARIDALDDRGPQLQAVLALHPDALEEARALDAEAAAGKFRGPLHGVPVLIKDNVETAELPTTAGSLALAMNDTGRDSPLIARLRAAGAIILGKTNLSEWANFRSNGSISGWSGVGGLTRNPHSRDRSACGSSSGSGAAVAAGYVPLAIGTETNGSITCPAAMNGIVGFKPTVGLVPRTYIVPISSTQDTAGPMTRSVKDAALMLTVMAGSDTRDGTSAPADARKTDYVAALDDSLAGRRIGVMRFAAGDLPGVEALFDEALAAMEAQGAELVEIEEFEAPDDLWGNEFLVLMTEFKATLNDYLAEAAPAVQHRTLADLITYNDSDPRELVLFDQSIFVSSEETKGLEDDEYQAALASILKATREDGIDRLLAEYEVDVLVAPSRPPAFLADAVFGDQYPDTGIGAAWMAAIAGYPNLTVPMGAYRGLPVGIDIMGPAWDDAIVLSVGHAYEQASGKLIRPSLADGPFTLPATRAAITSWETAE